MENRRMQASREGLLRHVRDFLAHGLPLQFMGGMTPDRMNAAFEHAKALFHQQEYLLAMDILKYLCLQDHLHKVYFLYLGACYQKTSRHEMAVKAYTHAAILDASDPRPHYNMAVCYLALDDLAGAKYAVLDAHQLSHNDEAGADMRTRVAALQRVIDTRKLKAA